MLLKAALHPIAVMTHPENPFFYCMMSLSKHAYLGKKVVRGLEAFILIQTEGPAQGCQLMVEVGSRLQMGGKCQPK
jgi:hypothetical protein